MNSKPLCSIWFFALSFALLAGISFSGCSVDMSSHTDTTGTYIGPKTAAQITPGKSSSYVEALIGEPTKKDKVSDNDEIWKYIYTTKRTEVGNAPLFTGTSSDAAYTHTTFVDFVDGTVVKCWQD